MKNTTFYALCLILGSLGFIVTMIFHPTGADVTANNENAAHSIQVAIYTHGFGIGSLPLSFLGFWGLSLLLGLERILTRIALAFYGFGAIAGMCAAVCSGFGATALAIIMLKTTDESSKQILQTVYSYNMFMNQGFSKILVVFSSVAVICWSISFLKKQGFGKILGVLGCVVGGMSLLTFFAGVLHLDVHGFGLFVFAQALWTILVAVWMFRLEDEIEA